MEKTGFFTASDGTEIWYGTVGEGTPIVLNDGFACDGFIWPYFIDHFHDQFQLIRWHYRGHGQSAAPRDDQCVSVEDVADDLTTLLDELQLDSAILAGHSMGVQVILQFYGLYPERVDALVPICGTYKRPLDTFHNHDRLAALLPYLGKLVDYAPDKVQSFWKTVTPSRLSLFASRFEVNARLVRSADFAPYLDHAARMDVRVFMRMLEELADHSAEEILDHVEVPTLIIAGERDTFTPLDRSLEMSNRIASSEILVLPGGSHIGPLELPDLVNGAVEKFLVKNDFR